MNKLYLFTVCLFFSIAGFTQNTSCDWAFAHAGTNTFNGKIYYTAIDNQSNIIQCGTIAGIADMDPGSGPSDTAFTNPGYNYYISKTDISGNLIWLKFFTYTTSIQAFTINGLEINSQNEIIVLGEYFGGIDVDLSLSGVDTLHSLQPTYPDFFLVKYDSNGDLQWANSYGGTGASLAAGSLALLSNDNIIVTFNPSTGMDLDPGTGISIPSGNNAQIVCYNNAGQFLWNNHITNPTSYCIDNKSVSCDGAGNSYLCSVGYYELTVTKFDNLGNLLWEKTIGDFPTGARVDPHSLLVYPDGRFFVVGNFQGSVDFDPGTGSLNYVASSALNEDGFFAAYDSSMTPIWIKQYSGGSITFGNQSLTNIGTDLITGGSISGTVLMGPGITFSSGSSSNFLLKVDASGSTIGGGTFVCDGITNTINSDAAGHLITAGIFRGNPDMDLTQNAVYTISSGTYLTSFIAVYAPTTSGLIETPASSALLVYPNPAAQMIRFARSFETMSDIEIYSSGGMLVRKSQLAPRERTIGLENISGGLYTLRLMNEKNTFHSRFMVID
ncbi:MAG: T9SS type A sorting domain-containing protein [Bacteroidetes bacterium]|nr:T9SS type A sorting domain-containing protein [Bacteroidota bacterium]